MSNERMPEYWQDVEKTILAAVINGYIEPLPPELFKNDEYFTLAKTAQDLHNAGKPVNFNTVIESSPNNLHTIREVADNCLDLDYTDFIEALLDRYKKRQMADVTKTVQRMLSAESPADAIADYMSKAMADIAAKGEPAGKKAPETAAEIRNRTKAEAEARTHNLIGLEFEGFPFFTKLTDGLQNGLYLIPARTNIGKTAFLSAFTYAILKNVENSPAVMVFSLDDSKEDFYFRLLSQCSGLPINDLKLPRTRIVTDEDIAKRNHGYEALSAFDDRFSLFDIDDIHPPQRSSKTAFDVLENMVKRQHTAAAGKPFVLWIDGLHNLDVGSESQDKRAENIDRAQKVQELADVLKIPIVCTVETRKPTVQEVLSNRPNKGLDDIMESGKYAFNASVVFKLTTLPEGLLGIKEPESVVCLTFAKNKRSGYKGDLFFRFNTNPSRDELFNKPINVKTTLHECDKDEQAAIMAALTGKTPASNKDDDGQAEKTRTNPPKRQQQRPTAEMLEKLNDKSQK